MARSQYAGILLVPGSNIETGRWRIRAQIFNWSATSEVDLGVGNNHIKFTVGQQGVTKNSKYPGE